MPDFRRRTILLCFFLAMPWGVSCGPLHNSDLELEYRLRIDPGEGILVDMTARGLRGKRPGFQILDGIGLLQDQPGHIEGLTARVGGVEVPVSSEEHPEVTVWSVDRGRTDDVRLRYRVRPYDPDSSPEASFVGAERAVVLGYSAFLVPSEITDYLPVPIRVTVTAPPGWPVWTSWPPAGTGYAPETSHDLWSGGVMAGDFTETVMETETARVRVLTEGRAGTPGLSVANRLHPILREMVGLFGAPPRDSVLDVIALYRVVPVRNGRSLMMGSSEENSFFCVATPDRFDDLEQLTALAAHECLHFYLGGALIGRMEAPYNNAPDLIWLIEGVTEYLTYVLMERAGIITPERFEAVHEKKRRLVRELGTAQGLSLAAAARSLTDADTYQLVYSKGFLIARYLDETMAAECGPGSFEASVRDLFESANFYRTHEWITPESVRRVFEARCPGAALLIERYAEGNASVPTMFSTPGAG